ncbi:MAG: glycine C-acetyltransferase [Proteobacteria bacterium]|nr:glycine C-acetyltransferase [Pseudomonadota bacterium]
MDPTFRPYLQREWTKLKEQGLDKSERIITSPQGASIEVGGERVLNLCANNYLGLSGHPALAQAAAAGLQRYGYGLSSVRFICGTQTVHKELEGRLAGFLGTDDAVLYSSCFDANGGLFETLLGADDAVISDELNHASIIDGIRLSKAQRFRYRNNDMADLESKLQETAGCRFRLIATDGVFSMDGTIANLQQIVELARRYQALTMVDDSHAVGFVGATGRGTPEHCGVHGQIDIITGTLGKALGGASGGYVAASREVTAWLRNRSRPYLFSNTLAPMIAAASLKALDLVDGEPSLRQQLQENATYFRAQMTQLGYQLTPGQHPIIPVMIGDAVKAKSLADALLHEGVYVISFSFPVVPKDKARIRTQMSAAHSRADLDMAVAAFAKVGRKLGLIP